MAAPSNSHISPLRGLLEVSRLVRAESDLPALLAAIARTVSASLGYETVVINLYRPAWDDFCVTTVHGDEGVRTSLLGQLRDRAEWESLLSERVGGRVASVLPAGTDDGGAGAWQPEDALFLPMRHGDGHLLGILSVDAPLSGLRPTDEELDVLVSLADHAALAVQSAQDAAEAARHRLALEQLLRVSSRLNDEPAADEILRAVCTGVRDALGFQSVLALLADPTSRLEPRAAVGRNVGGPQFDRPIFLADVEPLLDPAFEIEGCFLLPSDEAERRVQSEKVGYVSQLNGRGPRAWNRHWLLVPLYDRAGAVIGMLGADEPDDRLLPSAEKLQALRIFANQAGAAIVASAHLEELRFLADHDTLTRLPNRRAFVDRLDGEVARALRYDRPFGLVVCDLDGFKQLNDRFGHAAGDEALQTFARIVRAALRKTDEAFRIGGDEFAILLAEAEEDGARTVVRRIVERLEGSDDARLLGIRTSFGVATCPGDASDPQTLFRLADEALYLAKRNGSGLQFAA
ncbi:MAG TPA: sensor domain-containing diguanylate cyclase [Gaiellaceae bacterium]|nr:sensor domain-containing diguanylate cyclase [Gaiellaceae bacterium]